jgi:hypothetical protein
LHTPLYIQKSIWDNSKKTKSHPHSWENTLGGVYPRVPERGCEPEAAAS